VGAQMPFESAVFVGLILLVGIVVNNAIMLVEYINELRRGEKLFVYRKVLR
jgi:hydrophobic/amphiphilic exporter-1 (mainly G- bacteria), HAE1 family